MTLKLVIGNLNYSSWSIRPWYLMQRAGVDFEETRLLLDTPEFKRDIGNYSPSGRVPVLIDGDIRVWDSLAICEYVNELVDGALWPVDPAARARARSVSSEMHSSFHALRDQMPVNMRASRSVPMTDGLAHDIQRIQSMWRDARDQFGRGGPWLFGRFSIADAFFVPVVARFETYGVRLDGTAAEYRERVAATPQYAALKARGASERETVACDEKGTPRDSCP